MVSERPITCAEVVQSAPTVSELSDVLVEPVSHDFTTSIEGYVERLGE